MENKKMTNQEFLNFYGNRGEIRENRYGTVDAITYIIRNGKDEELIDTMNEIINEYVEIFKVDNKIVISTKNMPRVLSDKIIDKKERMEIQRKEDETNAYLAEKNKKLLKAEEISDRLI